jgi:hypothetical protein
MFQYRIWVLAKLAHLTTPITQALFDEGNYASWPMHFE